MDGAQVGVLKQLHNITLDALLKRGKGASLNTKVGSILLNYAPGKPLERQLPDQQLCRSLVTPDLLQGHSSRPELPLLLLLLLGRHRWMNICSGFWRDLERHLES